MQKLQVNETLGSLVHPWSQALNAITGSRPLPARIKDNRQGSKFSSVTSAGQTDPTAVPYVNNNFTSSKQGIDAAGKGEHQPRKFGKLCHGGKNLTYAETAANTTSKFA